ncbi:MAG: ASCH domain-containing protein [Actinomycetia bacterium]|nr:ASCH domain-containing protein [Actinomycetes bacterium]
MRRMSFSATVEQMRAGTKTVTRRAVSTWQSLQPGDQVLAIEKGMGLAKGEHQVPIGVIEIESNRVEPLSFCSEADAQREGFTSLTEFLVAWRRLHGSADDGMVRRISFSHSEPNP